MKRILSIAFGCIAFMLLFCSFSKKSSVKEDEFIEKSSSSEQFQDSVSAQEDSNVISSSISVTGLIHVYGNEPHTSLGLEVDDGTIYFIEASKETLAELQNLQGLEIKLIGTIKDAPAINAGTWQNNVIVVSTYSVVE